MMGFCAIYENFNLEEDRKMAIALKPTETKANFYHQKMLKYT